MKKNNKRKFKISRRIGVPLWGTKKDISIKKNYPAGMHGPSTKKKITEYGNQLIEKQKLKYYYGNIKEKQFKEIYNKAYKKRGNIEKNFIGMLESRLDAFVFRVNFAPTIYSARQYISHKHINVNGRCINIPSYILKPKDIVEIKNKSKKLKLFNKKRENIELKHAKINIKNMKAIYIKTPLLSEIEYSFPLSVKLIVEFYSR